MVTGVPALNGAPGQRRRLGSAQSGVGQHGDQSHVEPPSFLSLRGRFEAAAAGTGFRSGEADHGEGVGGEGAGLKLGLRKPPPPSL